MFVDPLKSWLRYRYLPIGPPDLLPVVEEERGFEVDSHELGWGLGELELAALQLCRRKERRQLTGKTGAVFRNARSFFLDLYRCDSRSWALNCWI